MPPSDNPRLLNRRAKKQPESAVSAKRVRPDAESDGEDDYTFKKSKTILFQSRLSTAPSSAQNPTRLIASDPILVSRIADSKLTDFQKSVLTALLHIPKGGWTTYGALARHLDSSPRAVGNALRNNPFAPEVPCHRVIATDKSIGGFKGDWGKNVSKGRFEEEKVNLLQTEGVIFDDRGKVMGQLWSAW